MRFTEKDAELVRNTFLPAVWNVFEKERCLAYCQLACEASETSCQATVGRSFKGNVLTLNLAFSSGGTVVALKKPNGDLFENGSAILQSSGFSLSGDRLKFSPKAKWLKHPEMLAKVGSDLCDQVRVSWSAGILYPR